MKRGTKIALGVVGVVGVVAVLGAIKAARSGNGVEVRIDTVAKRDLESVVNASGWVRPHRKVDVQSDIIGRVVELNIAEGDAVQRGQILLRIDPAEYESAVDRARAAVSEAQAREAQTRANLLQAERALDRLQRLAAVDSALVALQQLEESETEVAVQSDLLEAATYGVAQSRAALGEAQDRLSKTVIRAPMDGIVTRLNVDEGETAIVGTMNNPGSLLLTVADLSIMEAVVRVDETDVPELALGDSAALVFDAFPKETYWGRVTEISHSSVRPPENQTQTGQSGQAVDFEVVITIENPPAALRSDLSATADIVTDTRRDVLSIPIIALTVRQESALQPVQQEDPVAAAAASAAGAGGFGDVEGVFIVRNGKAEFVPVQVGIAGREHFEVLNGVSPGDSVVAGPYEAIRSLENGAAVRPASGEPSGPQRTAGS